MADSAKVVSIFDTGHGYYVYFERLRTIIIG